MSAERDSEQPAGERRRIYSFLKDSRGLTPTSVTAGVVHQDETAP